MVGTTVRKKKIARTMYAGLPANKRPVNRTLLYVWLKQHGISKDAFARLVGCDEKLVDFWCNGQVIPTLPYAFMVEKVTKGGVGAATWLGTELGRLVWNDLESKAVR